MSIENRPDIIEASEQKEILFPEKIQIKKEIAKQLFGLITETEEKKVENGALLFGREKEITHLRSYGMPSKDRVVITKEEMAAIIEEQRQVGFTVLADYHTHPSDLADEYEAQGMPAEYANYPSGNDIDGSTAQEGLGRFEGRIIPRLIGAKIKGEDAIRAFNILQDELPEGTGMIKDNQRVDDDMGIELWDAKIANPSDLQEKGVFKEIGIETI